MEILISAGENSGFAVSKRLNKKIVSVFVDRPYSQSEELLAVVKKIIKEEIPSKIFILEGPGQFSALRIGISMANALAYAWQVPIFGLRLKKTETVLAEKEKISLLWQKVDKKDFATKGQKIIKPFYDKEPGITIKKKK